MRSQIFNEFANLDKSFRDDFLSLWAFPQRVLQALTPLVDKMCKAETSGEQKAILDRTCRELKYDADKLLRAIKVLKFLRNTWNPVVDTSKGILKDFDDLGLLPPKSSKKSKAFLLDFLSSLEKDNARRLEKIFSNSILPSYRNCNTVVDFRAVFRNPYGSEEKTELAKYVPNCAGFVPVVIVQIERDSGNPNNMNFQIEESTLRILIDILQAALKDLRAAKAVFPGGKK